MQSATAPLPPTQPPALHTKDVWMCSQGRFCFCSLLWHFYCGFTSPERHLWSFGNCFFRTLVLSNLCTMCKCELTGQRASCRISFRYLTWKWHSWVVSVTRIKPTKGAVRFCNVQLLQPLHCSALGTGSACQFSPLKQKLPLSGMRGQLWFLKQSRKCAFGDHLNTCVTEQVRATWTFTLNCMEQPPF